jgi:7-cyano-7-deazaguanine synthase
MPKIVPIVSGGLDSVTMLYKLVDDGYTVDTVVSFNYGQRHKKELDFAARHAQALSADHVIIDLFKSGLTDILAGSTSSLTNPDVDVPEGHYAEENMKATVVPNRNMIMLSIACGIAVAQNAHGIATAVHAGDHFIYPDCRPDFMYLLNGAMCEGNRGFGTIPADDPMCLQTIFIRTPFLNKTKADIALAAIEHNVPFDQTWSCYKGGDIHCGKCGTCVERLEAIETAYASLQMENHDETEYEDTNYWRKVLSESF